MEEKILKSNWQHLGVYMVTDERPFGIRTVVNGKLVKNTFKFRTKTTHPILYLATISTVSVSSWEGEPCSKREVARLNLLNPSQFTNKQNSPQKNLCWSVRENLKDDIDSVKYRDEYVYLEDVKFLGTVNSITLNRFGRITPEVKREIFRKWEAFTIKEGLFVPKENPEFGNSARTAKDFFLNELKIGDTVVYVSPSHGQRFLIRKISNITDINLVLDKHRTVPPDRVIKYPTGLHKS